MAAFANVCFKVCKSFARALLIVSATSILAAALSTPGFAQTDGFGHPIKDKKEEEYHQPARNENAYKDALRRIPDTKEKYDPWGTVRGDKPATK
jgi:hypothetical protein